jgi:L-aspartate oxidase
MRSETFDFVVVGSGLAGLTYAIEAAEFGSVAVLTKAEMKESNTSYAQGGIAAAVGEADSWMLHEADTLAAGDFINDPEAVRFLVQNAPQAIEWLEKLGTQFDRPTGEESNGKLDLGLEGGHSRHRIVHYRDRTGREVERAMVESAKARHNIHIFEFTFATQLLMQDGACVGVQALLPNDQSMSFFSRSVMLATGGCGKLYRHTTNPRVATGDGIALAARAGATVENLEFMQFHPTTLYHEQKMNFLITEAVRGEGGKLRNHRGTRFMYDYDDRLELAPRDVVCRAIVEEMRKLTTWCVYLDVTHLPRELIEERFPTIYEQLGKLGLHIYRDWIPVVPAQHYCCGGVKTDLKGQTSVPRLFAAGETACTGVHGANRLASNSLLEAIVFARAAALESKNSPESVPAPQQLPPVETIHEAEAIQIRHALQRTMTEHLGIERTDEGMRKAKKEIAKLMNQYRTAPKDRIPSRYSLETENLLVIAGIMVDAALARRTNVGLHYNLDLPDQGSGIPGEAGIGGA